MEKRKNVIVFIIGVIVSLLVGIGGTYFVMNNNKDTCPTNNSTQNYNQDNSEKENNNSSSEIIDPGEINYEKEISLVDNSIIKTFEKNNIDINSGNEYSILVNYGIINNNKVKIGFYRKNTTEYDGEMQYYTIVKVYINDKSFTYSKNYSNPYFDSVREIATSVRFVQINDDIALIHEAQNTLITSDRSYSRGEILIFDSECNHKKTISSIIDEVMVNDEKIKLSISINDNEIIYYVEGTIDASPEESYYHQMKYSNGVVTRMNTFNGFTGYSS